MSLGCTVRGEVGTVHSDSAVSTAGGYHTTRIGALSDSVIHLADCDSVELQSAGTVRVPNEPDGLMVTTIRTRTWRTRSACVRRRSPCSMRYVRNSSAILIGSSCGHRIDPLPSAIAVVGIISLESYSRDTPMDAGTRSMAHLRCDEIVQRDCDRAPWQNAETIARVLPPEVPEGICNGG